MSWKPPKPPPPGEPIKISWNKIRIFEECKQKSKLYRNKVKPGITDQRVFFRGTVVDRVMRNWLMQEDPQPGQMADMVRSTLAFEENVVAENEAEQLRWKHNKDREETIAWCVRLVNNLEPILQELILPYEYEPAKQFEVPVRIPWIDGVTPTYVILNGEMDLLARDSDGRYMIWDLKGTENNAYWKKVMGQLVFYDIATAAMFGSYAKVAGLIQPLAEPRVMPFAFEKNDYQNMWQRIMGYAEAVWTEDDAPNEGNGLCAYCDYKFACVKFQPVHATDGTRRMVGLQTPTMRSGDEGTGSSVGSGQGGDPGSAASSSSGGVRA